MKVKSLAVVHFLVLVLLIVWNYFANTGYIDGKTIGSLSDKYDNLFTPAPYAFSIWGVIFLSLIGHGVYLLYNAFSKNGEHTAINESTLWLILAHLANATWVYCWLKEYIGLSVIVMIGILLFLLIAVIKLKMEKWDAPLKTMASIWWPIDLYVGWVAVALVANVSAYLASIGFKGGFSEVEWTMIIIGIVVLINLAMIAFRNMREFAAVGIWALIAIAVRHWGEISEIQWTALIAATILLVASGIHAYKNRATLPFTKLK